MINDVKYDKLHDDLSYDLVKQIYNFNNVLRDVVEKNEPYILSRYLIKLAQTYSDYYNTYKILSDDIDERNSRVYLVDIVANILKTGCSLLGIEMPEKIKQSFLQPTKKSSSNLIEVLLKRHLIKLSSITPLTGKIIELYLSIQTSSKLILLTLSFI